MPTLKQSAPGPDRESHQEAIDRHEMRIMNSRGRELLLKYWDFPVFASALSRCGLTLEGKSLLDAGCGSGYSLGLIWERFRPAALAAFDVVPSQVEAARKRNTPATVFVADITSLELPPESFDAAFVCGVLHHCRGWRKGLAEMARVLKRGGVLLIEEPGVAHLKFERMLTGKSPSLDAGFSFEALAAEMHRSGLGILVQRPLYFGLFRSYLCVKGAGAAQDHYAFRRPVRAMNSGELGSGQEVPA